MSNIKNEAKIRNPLIVAIREQLEHRALWMYLLCDEAAKKGLAPQDYAPAAIRRCGLYQGGNLRAKAGGGDSLKGLKKTLFTKPAQWVFEMDVKRCTDNNLDIDFHYCPLVKAWQKMAAATKRSSCCATTPCAVTAALPRASAVSWTCPPPSPGATMCVRSVLSAARRNKGRILS